VHLLASCSRSKTARVACNAPIRCTAKAFVATSPSRARAYVSTRISSSTARKAPSATRVGTAPAIAAHTEARIHASPARPSPSPTPSRRPRRRPAWHAEHAAFSSANAVRGSANASRKRTGRPPFASRQCLAPNARVEHEQSSGKAGGFRSRGPVAAAAPAKPAAKKASSRGKH